MSDIDFRTLNLNLLPALAALLRTRAVGRAARQVGVSQSAMSHSLAKLRDAFGDPLLVAQGRSMMLTPRARELALSLPPALERLRESLAATDVFDPATATTTFTIATVDLFELTALRSLLGYLARHAPGVRLRIERLPSGEEAIYPVELHDAEVRLDERTVELVVHQGSTVDLVAPATAAIRGVVLDADGSPVAEAVVSALATTALSSPEQRAEALRDRSAAGSKGSVLSDAEGRFTLPGLVAASTYTVLAQRRGGGVARAEAVATGGAIELHLQALASLHGQVTGVAAVSGLSVELRRSDAGTRLRESFVLDGGRFTFDKLAPGAYDVVAVAREGRGQAHVELVAGRDAILSVALVANRTLRGRFVELGTGAPLQDVVAVVGDDAAGPTEQAAKAEQLLQTRPAGLLSSGDGLFTVPDSPSATIHLLAISADIAGTDPSIVEFIVIAPTDGADGLLEIPLVRRRSGTKGKLGVELEIPMYCSDTPTVARVDDTLAGVDVRVGDEVAAIDGHDVTGRRCYLARQLMAAAPGAAVRLTLARGGEIELHAAAAP